MSDSTAPEDTTLAAASTDPGGVVEPEEPLVDELMVDELMVDELMVDELLVEEISIDGMCGVY